MRAIFYALPATYGIGISRSVMLRGDPPDPQLLAGLAALTVAVVAVSALTTRRQVRGRVGRRTVTA